MLLMILLLYIVAGYQCTDCNIMYTKTLVKKILKWLTNMSKTDCSTGFYVYVSANM